jgi:sensor c-di-GMP phosphodiesterase-like protein
MEANNHKTRWQNAFIYALVTTIMVLSAAAFLSGIFGEGQRQLAERVDVNARVAVQTAELAAEAAEVARVEAENTRDLICSILVNAESRQIRAAVRRHC